MQKKSKCVFKEDEVTTRVDSEKMSVVIVIRPKCNRDALRDQPYCDEHRIEHEWNVYQMDLAVEDAQPPEKACPWGGLFCPYNRHTKTLCGKKPNKK